MNTLRNIFILLVFLLALIISYSATADEGRKIYKDTREQGLKPIICIEDMSNYSSGELLTKLKRSSKVNVSSVYLFHWS